MGDVNKAKIEVGGEGGEKRDGRKAERAESFPWFTMEP